MEDGLLPALPPLPPLADVVQQDDGGVDHRAGQHDEGHQGDHGQVPAGEGQGEQGPAEGHGEDHHDDDGHDEGLELGGQDKVHQAQGHHQGQEQVAEVLHHAGVGAADLGGVALGHGVALQNLPHLGGDGGGVPADGVAGDRDLPGLVHPGDALGGLLDGHLGHGGQGDAAPGGGGDGHGVQGVQALARLSVSPDHYIQLLVVDGDGGGGGARQLGADGGPHGGGGQAVLGGGLPVHGDHHLLHLPLHGGGHVHRVGQLLDLVFQIVGDHGQGLIVRAGDVHADVAAAPQHGGHVGGLDGDLTAGDVLELSPQGVGHVAAAPVPVLLVAEHQADGGGLRLGDVIDGLQLRHILLGDLHHPVGDGGGVVQLGAHGGGDGDGHHALVHLGHEDHPGVQAGRGEQGHHGDGHPHTHPQVAHKEAQHAPVPAAQPVAQGYLALGRQRGLPLGLAQGLLPDLLLVQEEVTQQGDQGDGDDQGGQHQEHDGQAEVVKEHAGDAAGEGQGQKDGHRGQGGGGQGDGDLLGPVDAGVHPVVALGGPAVDVLQHHDGVVHDHAHPHGDAAQRHHVQGQVEDIHQHENGEDTHGHGHRDGGRGPQPPQEQEHHDGGQGHPHVDVLHGGVHRDVDVVGGAVQHRIAHGGVALAVLLHGVHHRLGGGRLVGPGPLGHLEHHAGRAVGLGHRVRIGVLQGHVGHLGQAHRPAGGQGEEHIGHVLHRLELGVGGDGQGLAAVVQLAAGVEQVLGGQHLGDIGVAQAIAGGPGRVHLHGDLLAHAAGDGHLGHAVHPLQGGDDSILGQGLDADQVVPHQGDDGRGEQVADVDVDDDRLGHPVRQGEHIELLPQLGGGDVQVGAVGVGDLELAEPVRGGGLDLLHPGHRHDRRLQGPADQLLHVLGAGPVVIAHHHGGGGLHVGEQGHLEPGGEHHPEDGDHDDRHQGGHLVLDAESGDTHPISPPRTRFGRRRRRSGTPGPRSPAAGRPPGPR